MTLPCPLSKLGTLPPSAPDSSPSANALGKVSLVNYNLQIREYEYEYENQQHLDNQALKKTIKGSQMETDQLTLEAWGMNTSCGGWTTFLQKKKKSKELKRTKAIKIATHET